jgi:hypothetical protein
MLPLNECLLLFISLSTQSGNFWIHPRTFAGNIKMLYFGCGRGHGRDYVNKVQGDQMEVSCQLYPWGTSTRYPLRRRLAGRTAGLDSVARTKKSQLVSGLEPRSSSP